MTQCIRAVFEHGVLRPLQPINLQENAEVLLTVEVDDMTTGDAGRESDDPLADIRIDTGIPDLAENFDDYRFGRKQP